ncbi:GcvT family protein [Roseibium alexandrii]|uniref:Glycine cleavage system T protein (Aminomethyltransferase) n=1 Tax=Roseibium alexandrii (strain DSM 17067 / NCIMB 14079 / DFL-11) TaxID=244592 RepID=A0A5E8H2I4_ROSAD|nr:FAD-dependent oxidoreductase [Roseibium alexandrii]EEE46155.1 Glycine cleavage system T protein (aminomethyltransferase) [Roseibium alexandrii DFL-11]
MKSHTQVVVIGGGVVGCSVLYHLTKLGWTDVVLVERSELTSGSSWHAAGGFHTLNGDPNVSQLQSYTVDLYKELEEISGQSCSLHLTGGVMLADTPERMDFLRLAQAKGRYLGMDLELISVSEAKKMFPILDEKYFIGALWDPIEGHLDPSGTTHAYAKAARINGAEIYRHTKVEEMVQTPEGTWDVITDKGTIRAEHVVNAGGLWARECGRMVGIELPVLAMEHMYLLTDEMPEVVAHNEATGKELIGVLDFGGEIYTRQEGKGMLLGTYEQNCRPWSPKETPWDFGHELLAPDLDRISPELEVGFEHFPALQNAGIKQIINGPFTFAPDGNPLVGPVRGLKNYWVACGVMAGFSQGGGVGLTLANWMIDGDPGYDIWGMDVARYGDWATLAYTNKKVQENYSRRFRIRFPNEELPAGRPHQTTPLYDKMLAQGAVMGDSWGLETPLWFAPDGEKAEDVVSFRRSNDFDAIGEECRAVRTGVGITEIANFAKYKITGAGAEDYLSYLMTNTMPKVGRIVLTPMLNEAGKLIGDFTIVRASDETFYMFGSSQAEVYHMRWFEKHLPDDGSVAIEAINLSLVGLSIAGPRARDVLAKVAGDDVSNDAFRFMDFREMDVANAPCKVNRISYTGDLGYEIWMTPEYERQVYTALMEAGAEFGIQNFGMRALLAMRLEKNFGTWFREFRPIYGPFEADLGRFVKLGKNNFIGQEAARREFEDGPKRSRVSFVVDALDADVMGDEPIWHGNDVIGWITSGGYAHHVQKSLAQGYVPTEFSVNTDDGAFEIEILGERRKATLITDPLFDPKAERMRM